VTDLGSLFQIFLQVLEEEIDPGRDRKKIAVFSALTADSCKCKAKLVFSRRSCAGHCETEENINFSASSGPELEIVFSTESIKG